MNLTLSCLRRHLLIVSLFLIPFSVLWAQLPAGFTDTKIQTDYVTPMGVMFTKNGERMFVWEKSGVLLVSNWNGTTYIRQTAPVIDIREEVGDWRDFGLQSIALDPNFDTNGLIYLFYQVDRHHLLYFGTPQYNSATDEEFDATISRLTRYKVVVAANNVMTADKTTRKILFGETKSTGSPILHESHGGGQIVFGTDGTLMVSTGDGANFTGADAGSSPDTYFQKAISDGIIRPTENVGAFRSQMLNSFSGKILRLDPNTGDGLPSNPYFDVANPRSAQSRVWTLGLRNPYRMALKTGTGSTVASEGNPGTLLVCDVQWGTWEEMNIIEKAGVNCGWPLFEGIETLFPYYDLETVNAEETDNPKFKTQCVQATSSVINPIITQRRFTHAVPALDWLHEQNVSRSPRFVNGEVIPDTMGKAGSHVVGTPFGGNAATTGTYYAGKIFPSNYRNVFFFADYGENWIKAAVLHDNSDHQVHEVKDFAPAGYCKGVVDIEYCPADGSIFYVNINTGDIQRISFGSGNRPPVAVISANKKFGPTPLTVAFTGTGSRDPDGSPLTYEWNFGDGTPISTAANPTHIFRGTGIKAFTVTLTVRDTQNIAGTASYIVSLNNTPPVVKITTPINNSLYSVTQATDYVLKATVTDNSLTAMKYAWQVTLRHNNHEHREPFKTTVSPTVRISPVGCDGEDYYYLIELTCTDNGGLIKKDSVKIYPNCTAGSLAVTNLAATPALNAVRLNWVNPTTAFDEIMVIAKPTKGFTLSPTGVNYVANANFKGDGTPFEGGKVVYKGVGNTVTVTNLNGGTRYFFRVYTRKGTAWTGGVEVSAIPTGFALVCNGDGKLYVETWRNIGAGNCYTDVPIYTKPTTAVVRTFSGFQFPNNVAEEYGMRVRGFICAPETGAYTFYIASDDGAFLFLSTDTDTAKSSVVAYIPDCEYTDPRQWTKFPEQKSAKINLVAGRKYYVEVIYKDGGGNDNLAVGWQRPSSPTGPVEIIPATSLNAFVPVTSSPVFNPNACYKLTSRLSNKVLAVANNSLTEGANIVQRTFAATNKSMIWRLTRYADTTYRILNTLSGKVIDVPGDALTPNTTLVQWDRNDGDNQRWIFTRNTEGYYKLTAKHSNLAMAVAGNSLTENVRIIQNTVANVNGQQWFVEAVTCPAGSLSLTNANTFAVEGYREGKKAVLNWISNSTGNRDYFIVQKLDEKGVAFEKMSIINAKNAGNAIENYNFIDENPSAEVNYYRIAQYFQGNDTPQYSDVIKLDFSNLNSFLVFPNPADEYIDVDLEKFATLNVTLSIMDVTGYILKQEKIDRAPIAPYRLSLDGLKNGMYSVRIEAKGKRAAVRPFVILK